MTIEQICWYFDLYMEYMHVHVQLCIGNARCKASMCSWRWATTQCALPSKCVQYETDSILLPCCSAIYIHFWSFLMKIRLQFFLEPKQKLLSNCTYRKRWNNMRHLESTFVASSPFDTVEISKQNTLKTFLCRFFSTTIRPCNNALTWSISHVSVSSINCDHKSNQWKSNDYSFQAVRFYSIGIVLPFINLDDYCKSFMLHFLHIGAVLFFGCCNIFVSMYCIFESIFLNLNLYETEIKASAKMVLTLWTLTTIPFIRAITFNKQLNNEWLLSYLENFLWNHNKMHTHTLTPYGFHE